MNEQQQLNYERIAAAIAFINENFKTQPSLEEVARQVHLSPFHFQRLFSQWAGTTPKKFLQYISLEHAKQLLKQQQLPLFDAALATGLSGTGRLHDLFISLEGMSPAEYRHGGKNLTIRYRFAPSPFGRLIVATTVKGICYMAFYESDKEAAALEALSSRFPNAVLSAQIDAMQEQAISIFQEPLTSLTKLKLHLQGTPFQLKVWEALLRIPIGHVVSYGNIAAQIGHANASRAVGTAIGSNPVAFLIPCHRVIQASGNIGGYRWGSTRKTAILGWERAQIDGDPSLLQD